MELLIIILLTIILITNVITCWAVICIEQWLAVLTSSDPEPPVNEEPKVTDPFTKPKEIHSSTPHIVVPKTPTEIRNQNFQKIKEGVEYGSISRG